MLRSLLIACAFACVPTLALAAQAGKVIFAAGSARVAGQAAAEGMPVDEGQLLATGKDGFLYVKTLDNGLFILRPDTEARIVTYHVDGSNPANTRIKLELLAGTARSKSGDAVKLARQNFRFNTPVAAIGVRGTDFTVYTDQQTTRIAVLTGGVVVSGFAGACLPEGGGPCEGSGSRELFAAQRGQLLQVKAGEAAPQLLPANGSGPDQVSPPRPDEPVAKAPAPGAPVLDAKKSESLDKLVSQGPAQPAQGPAQPPVVLPPATQPDLPAGGGQDTGGGQAPAPDPVPQLPERAIQWGRWLALAGQRATIDLATPAGAERLMNGDYVIFRTAGRDYVAPERGSVAFALQGGSATIRNQQQSVLDANALLKNGQLSIDFGKASFVTSFDVVSGSETFNMMAQGMVARDGRFANDSTSIYTQPQSNNMLVDGILGNENGGSAAYLFSRRIDDYRSISGVTAWGTGGK